MKVYKWHGITIEDTLSYLPEAVNYIRELNYKNNYRNLYGIIEDYTFQGTKEELLSTVIHIPNRNQFQDAIIRNKKMINRERVLAELNDKSLIHLKKCCICDRILIQGPRVIYGVSISSICTDCRKRCIERCTDKELFYIEVKQLNICKIYLLFKRKLAQNPF